MPNTRLFDYWAHQQQHFSQEDALVGKASGTWRRYSTQECLEVIDQVSRGLLALGINPGDKVALVSPNRPEWNFLDAAILQIGAVNVPLYPNISEKEYAFILNHAEARFVFVGTEALYARVKSVKERVKSVKGIYTFDEVEGADHWSAVTMLAGEVEQSEVERLRKKVKPEELATIIYTSGTTGEPKGVMLSHRNIVSNVEACTPLLPVDHTHKALSFLPLNHVFERMITYLYLRNGISIYYAENLDTIGENLKEVEPHIFSTVPRLLEKVYDKILQKGLGLKGIKRGLFFWALNLGLEYEFSGKDWWYRLQLWLANRLIFNKWRKALGSNVIAVVSGGAALQPRLARVFTAAQIPVMEGYGLTETSPVIAVNRFEVKNRMFGTVGPLIDGVEVKLAKDGEIVCKGPGVMIGYYKREDLTKEVIDGQGWFHTGDIGHFMGDKFLKITDRKKELLKTSGGKYVAPQPIENKFKESLLIEQVMVVGEGKKFVSALIMPAFDNLKVWCQKKNIPWTNRQEMVKYKTVVEKFAETVEGYNKEFSHTEQIKRFVLVPDEWSVETGELTPTMKLKRRDIMDKYGEMIDKEIYGE